MGQRMLLLATVAVATAVPAAGRSGKQSSCRFGAGLLGRLWCGRSQNRPSGGRGNGFGRNRGGDPVGASPTPAAGKPEIVLLTFSDRADKIFPLTEGVNRAYAARHGYRRVLDSNPATHAGLHPAWGKIQLLRQALAGAAGRRLAAAVVLDDDVRVAKLGLPVESWLDRYPAADIIVAGHDVENWADTREPGHDLNTGVIIVRPTDWSRQFFDALLRQPACADRYAPDAGCCWDQTCIVARLGQLGAWGRVAVPPRGELQCSPSGTVAGQCDPWAVHYLGRSKRAFARGRVNRGSLVEIEARRALLTEGRRIQALATAPAWRQPGPRADNANATGCWGYHSGMDGWAQVYYGDLPTMKTLCTALPGCNVLHDFGADGLNWRACRYVEYTKAGGAATAVMTRSPGWA